MEIVVIAESVFRRRQRQGRYLPCNCMRRESRGITWQVRHPGRRKTGSVFDSAPQEAARYAGTAAGEFRCWESTVVTA